MFGQTLLPIPALDPEVIPDKPKCIGQLAAARSLRDYVASRYDEANGYCYPGRPGIKSISGAVNVYDDTASLAAPEFASNMQEGVTPSFSRWTRFLAGLTVPEQSKPAVMQKLELVDVAVFDHINNSNFALEAGEAFQDLAIGTMGIDIGPSSGSGQSKLQFRAISPGNLLFLIGPDGLPDPIYEVRRGYAEHHDVLFPGSKRPKNAAEIKGEFEYIECYARDWSDPKAYRYKRIVFIPSQDNEVILDEDLTGEGACAKIVCRWSKTSGEGWGRGPALQCLSTIRKVNFAEQATLDHVEWQLAGMWDMEDDGVLNPETARILPGEVLIRAMGSNPIRNVAPGGNFDVAQFVLAEARKIIKDAFFNDALGDPDRSPKTATEIDARVAARARRIGTPMVRVIMEFVIPVVLRCVRLLKNAGVIELPKIDGKTIQLLPTSPLTQTARFEMIQNLTGFAERLRASVGDDAVSMNVDDARFTKKLADAMRVPLDVLRTDEEKTQMLANAGAAAGAAGEQGAGPGQADGGLAPQGLQ